MSQSRMDGADDLEKADFELVERLENFQRTML